MAKSKPRMMRCYICNELVPSKEFDQHCIELHGGKPNPYKDNSGGKSSGLVSPIYGSTTKRRGYDN
jgi:hypothetical protein